jgi:hypothetical protein
MGILRAVEEIFKIIIDEGEKEWLDETKYKEALNELYVKVEAGEITEDECDNQEMEILKLLKEVRTYKKEHGYVDRD